MTFTENKFLFGKRRKRERVGVFVSVSEGVCADVCGCVFVCAHVRERDFFGNAKGLSPRTLNYENDFSIEIRKKCF